MNVGTSPAAIEASMSKSNSTDIPFIEIGQVTGGLIGGAAYAWTDVYIRNGDDDNGDAPPPPAASAASVGDDGNAASDEGAGASKVPTNEQIMG